jgi:hypothetical protein
MKKHDDVVAVGQVNDCHIQVIRVVNEFGADFIWRALRDDKVIGMSEQNWTSIEDAFEAAVKFLLPDADIVDLPSAPDEALEALNSLLWVGGMQQDLESVEDCVMFSMGCQSGVDAIVETRKQAAQDFERARLIIASTHGPFHEAAVNTGKLAEIFDAQCQVLSLVLERSIETVEAFLKALGQ